MVSKNRGGPSRPSTGNKAAGRTSKKTKKPVTIDLEATSAKPVETKPAAAKSSNVAKSNEKSVASASSVPNVSSVATASKQHEKTVSPSDRIARDNNPGKVTPKAEVGRKHAEKQKDTPTRKNPPKSPESNESGFLGKLGAGVVGGAVALAGAWFIQSSGLLSSSANFDAPSEIAALKSKLAALEADRGSGETIDLAPIESRISTIEAANKAVADKSVTIIETQAKTGENLAALKSTIATLDATVSNLKSTVSSGGAGKDAGLAELASRIDELAVNVTGIKPARDFASDIAEVGKKLSALEDRISKKVDNIDTRLSADNKTLSDIGAKLVQLTPRIAALEEAANEPSDDEKAVAQSMAITGLKSAIDSGGGFSAALELYESLSGKNDRIAALRAFADKGIPTLSSLEKSTGTATDAIIKATAPIKETGIVGKFFDNARSLVKVKTIGSMPGESVEAIVSRIVAAVNTGNLAQVLKEWETLPDKGKAASKDWIEAVRARYEADTLIDRLLNEFMAGVAGNGN